MAGKTPPELVAVDRARAKVERLTRERTAAIRERNAAVRAAKAAGHLAKDVYQRAGITQSGWSRADKEGTG